MTGDPEDFVSAVESRNDFVFHPSFPNLPEVPRPFDLADTRDWLHTLRERLIQFSFVSQWALYYEDRGTLFCLQPEKQFSAQQKLEWMADFRDLDRLLAPFMMMTSREWKDKTTLDFYLHIFSIHQEHHAHHESLAVQCGAYILEHGPHYVERFSVDEFHTMIDALLSHMLTHIDWDTYDLLYRIKDMSYSQGIATQYGLTAVQEEAMDHFANTYRYLRHYRLQNHHHIDVGVGQEYPMVEIITANDENPTHVPNVLEDNIYRDSQNVHTKGISASLVCNIERLMDSYQEQVQDSNILAVMRTMENQWKQNDLWTHGLDQALRRIRTDPSSFRIGDHRRVTARDVFLLVYSFVVAHVENHPLEEYELLRRLAEEVGEASGTCISGHVSRMINALVGFHPDVIMAIDPVDHGVVRWQRLLQERLADQEDDVMMAMTRPYSSTNSFVLWILQARKDCVRELQEEGMEMETIHQSWNKLFPAFVDMTREPRHCFWCIICGKDGL